MEPVDFRMRVNYTNNVGNNIDKDFFESDYKHEAALQQISPFKLLKNIVDKFSKTCNANYYIFSIQVNGQIFEIISTKLDRILLIEGFKSYGSGGGDAFPVSIGIIDFHKNIRVEFMDGRFIARDN